MLETNKQALLFNFGEDLSYFVIYDDFVKEVFQKTFLVFQMGRKSLVEYEWLWLHTTRKSLLGISSMINNQIV